MTAAETELVAAPPVVRHLPPTPHPEAQRAGIGTVAASLVIVGGTAGMAAAASGALPGEPLYPIKRGVEQVTTAVRFGDASQGRGPARPGRHPPRRGARRCRRRARPRRRADRRHRRLLPQRRRRGLGEAVHRPTRPTATPQDIDTVRDVHRRSRWPTSPRCPAASSRRPTTLLVDAADTLADIDQQARVLCGACAPGATARPARQRSAPAPARPPSTTCSPARSPRPRPTSTAPRREAARVAAAEGRRPRRRPARSPTCPTDLADRRPTCPRCRPGRPGDQHDHPGRPPGARPSPPAPARRSRTWSPG